MLCQLHDMSTYILVLELAVCVTASLLWLFTASDHDTFVASIPEEIWCTWYVFANWIMLSIMMFIKEYIVDAEILFYHPALVWWCKRIVNARLPLYYNAKVKVWQQNIRMTCWAIVSNGRLLEIIYKELNELGMVMNSLLRYNVNPRNLASIKFNSFIP